LANYICIGCCRQRLTDTVVDGVFFAAAVTTVPNAKIEVLGPHEIQVSWDAVFQDMVSSGVLLGFKIHYRSAGDTPPRTIILVETAQQHVIPELSESR